MIRSPYDLMGGSEGEPRREQLPAIKDIFPISSNSVTKGVLALRDIKPKVKFVFQEQDHADSVLNNYLDNYFGYFQTIELDAQSQGFKPGKPISPIPGPDKESFFLGAMFAHAVIRNQVNALNEQKQKLVQHVLREEERIELPHFEDANGLLESEIQDFDYWRIGTQLTNAPFGEATTTRLMNLAKPTADKNEYRDNTFGFTVFSVSALCDYPQSFNAGAAATYFAMRNAIEANRIFEEIPVLPQRAI